MSLTITDVAMSSSVTVHTARLVDAELGLWVVSWLDDKTVFGRNQAVTAMSLAETVTGGVSPSSREWPLVVAWSNELGVPAAWAVERIVGCLALTTAKVEAAVETGEPMESDAFEGQQFLPTKIVAHYVPDGRGWRVSHVFVDGPVIRKRGGQLGSRRGYVWFSAAPEVATLALAPKWAQRFAEQNIPGGGLS